MKMNFIFCFFEKIIFDNAILIYDFSRNIKNIKVIEKIKTEINGIKILKFEIKIPDKKIIRNEQKTDQVCIMLPKSFLFSRNSVCK